MIWIEIICDGCNCNPEGEFYSSGSVTRLKKKVKALGWKMKYGRYYCPDCLRIMEREGDDVRIGANRYN